MNQNPTMNGARQDTVTFTPLSLDPAVSNLSSLTVSNTCLSQTPTTSVQHLTSKSLPTLQHPKLLS